MIPGEYKVADGDIEMNIGRKTKRLRVSNTGDRPIQIGSHYPFVQANQYLVFHREATFGMHLNIPAGTAVRFEPGEEKEIELTVFGGEDYKLEMNSDLDKQKIVDKVDHHHFRELVNE
ncbi:urease subunit beta [Bacillus chungangensis]|uniref:Urease beta subunit n=1 Tax=Bacillus chungangensis TaxID=587633 RepID=A0ABT9WNQ2_9BACI|nr:urease subunit beta [Bacillus chungangensis]MDQ0174896.1 urease beta subunit [Bacillus chungangensis]